MYSIDKENKQQLRPVGNHVAQKYRARITPPARPSYLDLINTVVILILKHSVTTPHFNSLQG